MFLLQDYQINGLDVNTTETCENQGGTNGINGGQQGQFLPHNFGSFSNWKFLIGFVEIRGQPELLIGDPPCCYHPHNIHGSNHVTPSEAMEAAMTNSLRKRGRTDSHFCNGPAPRQQATMTPIGKLFMQHHLFKSIFFKKNIFYSSTNQDATISAIFHGRHTFEAIPEYWQIGKTFRGHGFLQQLWTGVEKSVVSRRSGLPTHFFLGNDHRLLGNPHLQSAHLHGQPLRFTASRW